METKINSLLEELEGLKDQLLKNKERINLRINEGKTADKNASYLIWSGSLEDLLLFGNRVKEWLDRPYVTEAKRNLTAIIQMTNDNLEQEIKEILKDDRFLSANHVTFADLRDNISRIHDATIRTGVSKYVVNRIREKDLDKAYSWANNAMNYSNSLDSLKETKLSTEGGMRALDLLCSELSKVTSFHEEKDLSGWAKKLTEVDQVIKNRPNEITEQQIMNYLVTTKPSDISEMFDSLMSIIEEARTLLSKVAWINDERVKDEDYAALRKEFTGIAKSDSAWAALQKLNNLDSKVSSFITNTQEKTKSLQQVVGNLIKAIKDETISNKFTALKNEIPMPESIYGSFYDFENTISKIRSLQAECQKKLRERLKDPNAIALLQSPTESIKKMNYEEISKAILVLINEGILEITAEENAIKLKVVG